MDSISLNAVRTAVADVVTDTLGTSVPAPAADIAGYAAAARAAPAGAATGSTVAAVDVVATAVVVAADSADDLCRRACHVRRHCGVHALGSARSGRHFWL